jgi:hypothetical protein
VFRRHYEFVVCVFQVGCSIWAMQAKVVSGCLFIEIL